MILENYWVSHRDISEKVFIPSLLEDFLVQENGPSKKLPNLEELKWPDYVGRIGPIISAETKEKFQPFSMQMSLDEREIVYSMLEDIFTAAHKKSLGLCLMATGGSVLGSFRHHDFIPWDDDLDLGLNKSCEEEFVKVLKSLQPKLAFDHTAGSTIKVFRSDGVRTNVGNYPWNWPYLDISLFAINVTHRTEIPITYDRQYSYPLATVFPLLYRPFGRLWLPSHFNIYQNIFLDYGPSDQCTVNGYSHILEDYTDLDEQPCRRLATEYAFVRRTLVGPIEGAEPKLVWVNETLFIATNQNISSFKAFHSLILPAHIDTVTVEPFGLHQNL
ncbi:hypothetical protein Ciccas_013992 [Cichlidogyrus casuarinus]|uniref:LicD/FKTN/FKRP nucleotidyltransferase domain-containing protein n=1 Tax=Cichlidogyrus casuarinus TaxID=1844966 RepID=A0ABD2PP33_9PLAT